MAIERRPLKKAPRMDVVEAFTRDQTPATVIAPPAPSTTEAAEPAAAPIEARDEQRTNSGVPGAMPDAPTPRRGPGRPRSSRRMEQLATKIEIGLRDEVDAYLAEHGGTLVDLIDEALRDRLKK